MGGGSLRGDATLTEGGTLSGDIDPDTDNSYRMGTNTNRMADVYTVTLHTGDLNLRDPKCPKCGDYFQPHETIQFTILNVYGTTTDRDEAELNTVPVHAQCTLPR